MANKANNNALIRTRVSEKYRRQAVYTSPGLDRSSSNLLLPPKHPRETPLLLHRRRRRKRHCRRRRCVHQEVRQVARARRAHVRRLSRLVALLHDPRTGLALVADLARVVARAAARERLRSAGAGDFEGVLRGCDRDVCVRCDLGRARARAETRAAGGAGLGDGWGLGVGD